MNRCPTIPVAPKIPTLCRIAVAFFRYTPPAAPTQKAACPLAMTTV
jgi:hypothetical protein